jgi:hypothetical protein
MKLLIVVSACFLAGFLLGDAHGYIQGLQVAEASQWAN